MTAPALRAANLSPETLADRLISGDRAALARAITLIESRKPAHQEMARALMQAVLPRTGKATRVGITGVPGVGKSTLIDTLGTNLTGQGHRIAVLAIDPSSTRTGGSILGDKMRMARLANDRNAFIRPSPAAGMLGGVATRTRETMLLCEAAGFDVILVETVGIGQSESAVADMTDFFLVLMLPGAGDELQGIKKGVLELADMIANNKAEGEGRGRAEAAKAEYLAALHILQPTSLTWSPPVVLVSGLANEGLEAMWAQVIEHRRRTQASGEFDTKRCAQQVKWMWTMLEERLHVRLRSDAGLRRHVVALEARVAKGELAPTLAVEDIARMLGV
ncbi:MAG: methylmalonyl Co-A mutase-associated GTPase MeaB [Beijerinckiaceae bacterium]